MDLKMVGVEKKETQQKKTAISILMKIIKTDLMSDFQRFIVCRVGPTRLDSFAVVFSSNGEN